MELHVVFSYSARASLIEAFGPDIPIARFSDDLSYGPINAPEAASRRAWTEAHLGYDNPDITEDEQIFWPRVLAPGTTCIAWFSRRNAREYCGFLEYLRRLDSLPTDIIDATDAERDDGSFFSSVAAIPGRYILQTGLHKHRHALMAQDRASLLALWDRLRADTSGLRILTQDLSLLSVPLSYYDEEFLKLVGEDWRSMAVVVGEAIDRWLLGELFIMSRLHGLADRGLLDMRETSHRHPDIKRVHS